jgi:hypothetical protein
VLGQARPDDCLAYVPLNPRKEWPVRVRSISGKSALQRSVDTEDSSHHGRLQVGHCNHPTPNLGVCDVFGERNCARMP